MPSAKKNTTKTAKTAKTSKKAASAQKSETKKSTAAKPKVAETTRTTKTAKQTPPSKTNSKKATVTSSNAKSNTTKGVSKSTSRNAPKKTATSGKTAKQPTKTTTKATAKAKTNMAKAKTDTKTTTKVTKKTSAPVPTVERDPEREKYLMGWQRKMDPSNFNKSRGAQYHTAPTVVMPGDMGYPEDLPKESVTFLFRITDEGWIGEPEKMVIDNPLVIEKEPRKGAKNGPVFVLSAMAALCSIAYKENYYWSANVLSKHQVLRMKFVPEKKRTDGKKRNIVVYATFMPNEDE